MAAAAAVVVIIILAVVLTLPETVSCHGDDEKYFVVKVPVPEIARIEPAMVCNYYADVEIQVIGRDFLFYNGERPRHAQYYNDTQAQVFTPPLAIDRVGTPYAYRDDDDDDLLPPKTNAPPGTLNTRRRRVDARCRDVDVRKQEVELCQSYFTVVPALHRTGDGSGVNAADFPLRRGTGAGGGTGRWPPGRKPKEGALAADGMPRPEPRYVDAVDEWRGGWSDTAVDGGRAGRRQTYYPDVRVTSPRPADPHPTASTSDAPCMSHVRGYLAVTPPPMVADVFPPLLCGGSGGNGRAITLTGEQFIRYRRNATDSDHKPSLELRLLASQPSPWASAASSAGSPPSSAASTLEACESFAVHEYDDVEHCTSMTVPFNAATNTPPRGRDTVTTGLVSVHVRNPPPIDCRERRAQPFVLIDTPRITRVDPPAVCVTNFQRRVRVHGQHLVTVDGVVPKFVVDGTERVVSTTTTTSTPTPTPTPATSADNSTSSSSSSSLGALAPPLSLAPATCVSVDQGAIYGHTIDDCSPLDVVLDVDAGMRQLHFANVSAMIATGARSGNTGRPGSPPGTVDALYLDDCTTHDFDNVDTRLQRDAVGVIDDDLALLLVPPPTIDSLEPAAWCASDTSDIIVTLTGQHFLRVRDYNGVAGAGVDALPEVIVNEQLADDADAAVAARTFTLPPSAISVAQCVDVVGNDEFEAALSVATCAELRVVVPSTFNDRLLDGTNQLSVRNPAPTTCEAATDVTFVVYPQPVLNPLITRGQSSNLFCSLEEDDVVLAFTGIDVLRIDGVAPTVRLSTAAGADGVGGALVPAAAVTITGCSSTPPTGSLSAWTSVSAVATAVEYCTAVTLRLSYTATPTLWAQLPTFGSVSVTVVNPAPTPQCASITEPAPAVVFHILPTPVVTVTPSAFCQAVAEKIIRVASPDLLRYTAKPGAPAAATTAATPSQPTVHVAGHQVDARDVLSVEGCTPVSAAALTAAFPYGSAAAAPAPVFFTDAYDVERCDAVTVIVNGTRLTGVGDLDIGFHVVQVAVGDTPLASDLIDDRALLPYCPSRGVAFPDATADVFFGGTAPAPSNRMRIRDPAFAAPVLTSVRPPYYCFAEGGSVAVTGERLATGMDMYLRRSGGGGPTYRPRAGDVVYDGERNATLTMRPNEVPPAVYDLHVNDVLGGCGSDVLLGVITVQPQPLVFFVDPPVYYTRARVQATIFTSGLSAENPAALVTLLGPTATDIISFGVSATDVTTTGAVVDDIFQIVDGNANRLQLVVPVGLSVGVWTARVETTFGCGASVANAFSVVDTLTVDVSAVTPGFVWRNASVGVEITSRADTVLLQNVTGIAERASVERNTTVTTTIVTLTRVIDSVTGAAVPGSPDVLTTPPPTSTTTSTTTVLTSTTVTPVALPSAGTSTQPPTTTLDTTTTSTLDTPAVNLTTIVVTNTTTTTTTTTFVTLSTSVTTVEQLVTLGQFRVTPRLYLNPQAPSTTTPTPTTTNGTAAPYDGGGEAAVAAPMRAVVFQTPGLMTAVVPANLPVGVYDVIAINPPLTPGGRDYGIGVLRGAVTILAAPPPAIHAVTPVTLSTTTAAITVTGENFVDGAMEVTTFCLPNGDTSLTATESVLAVPAGHSTTQLSFSITGTVGDVCVVRVRDTVLGGSDRFSSVSFRSGSANFVNEFARRAVTLNIGRTEHVYVEGRATSKLRFVYAIGGQSEKGDTGAATLSVEAAQVDEFGVPSPFRVQTENPLPRSVTGAAGASIGRFIYVFGGGSAGTGIDAPDAGIVRAEILNPLLTPLMQASITAGFNRTSFGTGSYVYLVSALFAADDANNPGGESLPGEAFTISLPTIPQSGTRRVYLSLALSWSPVPNAIGYRLFRTPSVNQPVTEAVQLAVVTAPAFVDDGRNTTTTSDLTRRPLQPGSLGRWHSVLGTGAQMLSTRTQHSIAVLPHPSDPLSVRVYAVGGRSDAALAVLDTIEFATVTTVPAPAGVALASSTQTVSAWQLAGGAGATLTGGWYAGQAWGLTDGNFLATQGADQFLIVGPGRLDDGSASDLLWNGRVDAASGTLVALTSSAFSDQTEGCFFAASGSVYVIGGVNRRDQEQTAGTSDECVYSGATRTLTCGGGNSLGRAPLRSPVRRPACVQLNSLFQIVGGYAAAEPVPLDLIEVNTQ